MNIFEAIKAKFTKKVKVVLGIVILVIVLGIVGTFVYLDVAHNRGVVRQADPHLSADQLKSRQEGIDKLKVEIKQAKEENRTKEQMFVLYSRLGGELKVVGQYDEALQAYNEAKILLPDNASIYAELYELQNTMHDYGAALESIKTAVNLNPANPDYWANYLVLERDYSKLSIEERLKQVEEAKSKTAQAAPVMNQYALLLEEQGKLKEAYEVLREVVIANPSNYEYLKNLDEINVKLQNEDIKNSHSK